MKIIFLNGPPSSGKDTAGQIIENLVAGAKQTKFAKELKLRTHAAYGLFGPDGGPLPHDYFEKVKDIHNEKFLGLTPRRAYIHMSETYFKPVHGNGIFGRLVLPELIEFDSQGCPAVAITDSGFLCEARPVIHQFGQENCYLVNLVRRGTSFNGDSRDWLCAMDMGLAQSQSFILFNHGRDTDELVGEVHKLLTALELR